MADENGLIQIREFYNNLKEQGRLLNHRFGITVTKSGFEDISLFGQSANVPKRTIETATLQYFGQTFEIPTTIDEGRRWPVELHTDANNNYYNRFRAWQEEYASWERSGGGYKGVSTINGYIDIYNNEMTKIVDSFTLKGLIPLEVGELSFSHSESNIASFSVEFLFLLSFNSKRSSDPLR